MRTQLIRSPSRIHPSPFAIVLGLAMSCCSITASAQDLVVNSFDDDGGGGFDIAWSNFRAYANGVTHTFDPAQDSTGNADSGSMYVQIQWPYIDDPKWVSSWQDIQFAWPAGPFNPSKYVNFECDIKIDVTNSYVAQGGASYGQWGMYVNDPWTGIVNGGKKLAITNGWQRLSGSFASDLNPTNSQAIITFLSNGSDALTNTVSLWIDNIVFTAALSRPPTNGPTLRIAKAPPAGLTCIASQPGDTWQRQMVSTVNSNYSWNTSSAVSDTTTYSMTIASAPDASYNGFASQMFLIPALGMGGGGGNDDWGSANVMDLFVQVNGDGTATGHFQYKVNQPNSWNTSMEVDQDCATGPLGTWSLTFNNNTNVTITAPDNTSTNFTIPESDASNFADPLLVAVGSQPNGDPNIGQASTFSRIQVTGAAGSIDDTFATLDPGVWAKDAADPAGISITAWEAKYSLSWFPADSDFGLQSSVDLASADAWTPLVPSAGVVTVGFDSGPVQTVVLNNSELPAEDQGYWRLSYNPFSRLQVLLPGETAAPGTPTGKTGTPDSQKAGPRFPVTINGVASDWSLKSSVRDLIGLSSLTASGFAFFYPSTNFTDLPIEQVRLVQGSTTVWAEIYSDGLQTITASNISNGAIEPDTSSEFQVNY